METTVNEIEEQSPSMYRVLPSIPDGLDINVGSFLLDAAQNTPSQPVSFRQEVRTLLYPALIRLQSKAHIPDDDLVPPDCPAAFIHLIRADPTSAAFSFLTMYSIRHRTITDHPDSFDHLFAPLLSEKHFHGIGTLTIPSPSPLQLIKPHRGPILIELSHSNEIRYPFHLEPARR